MRFSIVSIVLLVACAHLTAWPRYAATGSQVAIAGPTPPVASIPCVPPYLSEGGMRNAPLQLVISGQSNAGDPCLGLPPGAAPYYGLGEAFTPYAHWRRAARGGAPISAWNAKLTPRFENDQEWVWPSLQRLLSAGQPIDAFVWVHGESDALDDALRPVYYDAARELFARVRATIHAAEPTPHPDVLIVITSVADFTDSTVDRLGDRARFAEMRSIQRRLATAVPRTVYVEASDLSPSQHYCPGSCAALAERVIAAIKASSGKSLR